MARLHAHLSLAACLLLASTAATAQTSLDDQKKQLEIEQLELNKQKTMADMIAAARTQSAGSGTLTAPELTAEGLLLSRHVQEKTAERIVQDLGTNVGPISIVFGEQPPSTAEYVGLMRGAGILKANLRTAAELARDHYQATAPLCATLDQPQPDRGHGEYMEFAGIGLALSAVTTVASLLRVNTTFAGAALAAPDVQFKSVLVQKLKHAGWTVDPARPIVTSTSVADGLLADMGCSKTEAATHYATYLMHLARSKDGKPGSLPDAEVTVGQALATVLSDYSALEKGLYTPVNGVLPASVIEEEAKLVEPRTDRRILYIQHQKAALTTITKQGFLTGIIGIPAYVSASHVVEYSAHRPEGDLYNAVHYDTPVMRVTGVKAWLISDGARTAVAVGGD